MQKKAEKKEDEAKRLIFYHGSDSKYGCFSYGCSRCLTAVDLEDCYCRGCGARLKDY